jgi:hypothetical protein
MGTAFDAYRNGNSITFKIPARQPHAPAGNSKFQCALPGLSSSVCCATGNRQLPKAGFSLSDFHKNAKLAGFGLSAKA